MTIALLCVLIAAILPYIWAGYAKFSTKGYDNRSPREFLAKTEGKAKRANFAQLNSFEAFPAFAAAVIIAHLRLVDGVRIADFAVAFVVFRILYGICYIADKPRLRSVIWFAGFICVVILFLCAITN